MLAAALLWGRAARTAMINDKWQSEDRPDYGRSGEVIEHPWSTPPEFPEGAENEGIQIDALEPGTKVRVQTRNSEYWLTVLEGGHRRVTIQGGILPTVSEGRVEGATDGGTAVHTGWIEVNRSLEVLCGPRRIVTSRVCSISIEKPAAA